MSESQREQTYRAPVDLFFDSIREGLNQLADMITPPQSARDHFRESRIEMLKGFRDILDHRIDRLSHTANTGARVPVD